VHHPAMRHVHHPEKIAGAAPRRSLAQWRWFRR
jgi:hypothetical protein